MVWRLKKRVVAGRGLGGDRGHLTRPPIYRAKLW
jgi:hypothetical protein